MPLKKALDEEKAKIEALSVSELQLQEQNKRLKAAAIQIRGARGQEEEVGELGFFALL